MAEITWTCASCTFVNSIERPGCEICSNPSPSNQKLSSTYGNLKELQNQNIAVNQSKFDCSICFNTIEKNHGVMLHECLHCFCRECLCDHVMHCTEPAVMCPYTGDYRCSAIILEREVKAIVKEDVYRTYLKRSLRHAETQDPSSYHCKTKNCEGWCFFMPGVNEFYCGNCKKINCLRCRVIHHPKNCRDYQRGLVQGKDAQESEKYFKRLIKNGEAMKCPGCEIIIQKQDGCNFIKCAMCQMEICWITKQRRWGPGGRGDISMGCRCGVDRKKCHPECWWCSS